jgi:hypothetical protein
MEIHVAGFTITAEEWRDFDDDTRALLLDAAGEEGEPNEPERAQPARA